MQLPLSTKEPFVFSPAAANAEGHLRRAKPDASAEEIAEARREAESAADAIRWLIKVPSYLERVQFRKDMADAGAIYAGDIRLFAAARAAIQAAAPANAASLIGLLDDFEARDPATRYADEAALAQIDRVMERLRGADEDVTRMLSGREFWVDMQPVMALRRFLIGVQGRKPLPRSGPWLTDDAIDALMQEHGEAAMKVVGWQCAALLSPSKAAEKN